MPTWKSSVPDISGLSLERQVEALLNYAIENDRRQSWFMSKLDSKNVKRLDTNETSIKSAYGETIIDGPVLEMYDKQAVPVLRLKQGYDSVTSDFVYNMYNKAGVQTVGIDSNGNATFTGTITGSTITGGTIQTAATGRRIVLSGSELNSMNSATKDGFTLDGVDGFLRWYTAGVNTGYIGKGTNPFSLEEMLFSHDFLKMNGAWGIDLVSPTVNIGQTTGDVYLLGNADFTLTASVVGLSTNSYSHAHGGATGVGGADNHTHPISSDNHSHSVIC